MATIHVGSSIQALLYGFQDRFVLLEWKLRQKERKKQTNINGRNQKYFGLKISCPKFKGHNTILLAEQNTIAVGEC